MSLVFGVYMSLIGIAVVFITFLAVVAACEVLLRLISRRAGTPHPDRRKLARLAATAAVHYYMGLDRDRHPRLRVPAESRWSAVAKIEALMMEGERFR